MDYSRQINERWASFGGRARQEVDADLGSGSVFRLIGRGGIIFCRGPFCWELNADAREAGGIYLKEIAAWCFPIELKNTVQKLTRHSCDLTVKRRLFIRDRHAMYIVKKRLNEGEGKYRIYCAQEPALVFVRFSSFMPPTVTDLLKTRVHAGWCQAAGAWMLSELYEGELYRVIDEINSQPAELTDYCVL